MRRGRFLFNDGWKFALTPPDSDAAALDGAHWYDVEIPHDWLIGDTSDLYRSGCGWYKKNFHIDTLSERDEYILCFDGVYADVDVFVGGQKAGEEKHGYVSFCVYITDYLHEGDNEILVRVNHKSPNTRWYSGAGMYRNVYIRHTDKIHIPENGIYIHTKSNRGNDKSEGGRWKLEINTRFSKSFNGYVRYLLKDNLGNTLVSAERQTAGDFDKFAINIDNVLAWSPDFPFIYHLGVLIFDENKNTLDVSETSLGFRTAEFSPSGKFRLNSQVIKLKGVCLHHDAGALGAAVNYDAIRRQLVIMKNMGVNAVRTSHNPPAPELLDICDTLGILVIDEFTDMWEMPKTEYDYARYFKQYCKEDVERWICRDRNHPSVIMWSIGNEIPDTNVSEHGTEIAQMLLGEVKKHDSLNNAIVTIGSNYMQWENARKTADVLEAAGYNYAERLYKEHHKQHPDWCIYGSEVASTVSSRGIYHFPADTAQLTRDDMQCSELMNSVVSWGASPFYAYLSDRDSKCSMGYFVWTGFDYIGEPTPYNTKNSYFGIVDTAGFPKDSYWFYKFIWDGPSEKPYVHINTCWDYNEGQMIDIIAYSNLPVLRMTYDKQVSPPVVIDRVNGSTLYAHWKIPFRRGKSVCVSGYKDTESKDPAAKAMLVPHGDAASLETEPDRTETYADGRSLVYVTITAVDKLGMKVGNANNRVKVTVEGCGRLVGLDNGDSTDYDSYKGDNRRMFSGKLLAIIQTTLEAGEIRITAQSKGLEGSGFTLMSKPCELPESIYEGVPAVSVVSENAFPAVLTEYTDEVPIRKIELAAITPQNLGKNQKTAFVGVKLHPANATYKDIEFKCCSDSGYEIPYASVVDFDGSVLTLRARGDGAFKLCATAKNGGNIPGVLSELCFTAEGLGEALKNPYVFNAACLCNYNDKPINVIERGALGSFNGRTVIGFLQADFGSAGTDRLILSIGNCTHSTVKVDMHLDDPENKDGIRTQLDVPHNDGWDRAYPNEYTLETRIRGIHDVYFTIYDSCIFGGFEFVKLDRAYGINSAADADAIYGDDFEINENRVENIGNNVVIEFKELDFGKGAEGITIKGKTPLDFCSVQLRITPRGGTQTSQMLKFGGCGEYTEQSFTLEKISGVNDISFVFLPGSRFDMDSFRFTEGGDR